ncbi:GNAT family N-acetyltransferase [Staphylococcus canis]|uniref:N-acetyltransferase n=1 Tax=Staphylococcus canis TaxID=2724942 RepID=A0ABS0TBA1_9STAP|nr:N-acetyltransferase [Staphylococcus canis]MBI5976036.1 N-acetyltransferase [Staphylococcus canis]
MSIFISTLTENDYNTSLEMVEKVFETTSIPAEKMVQCIKRLRYAPHYRYELEVIAKTEAGEIIGHALCSEVELKHQDHTYTILAIASLAVAQAYQSKGIGKALVQALEDRALSEEYTAIVVEDYQHYFKHLGYDEAQSHDIEPPSHVDPSRFRVKFLWDTLEDPPHGEVLDTEVFID